MNIEREDTGTLTATLELTLTPEDYRPAVDKVLKEQRKSANLPGFRPGQVPLGLIKKRIGKSVLVNEVERLVDTHLRNYIEENELRVLGQPLPNEEKADTNNWDDPGEFKFRYDVGIAPVIEVDLDRAKGVKMPVVEVDDELVDKEIADMRRRFGTLSDAGTVEEQDMVIGELVELDADGAIKEGGLMNRTTITIGELADEDTKQQFIGKAIGVSLTLDPHKISLDHDDLARMLDTDHGAVHALAGDVMFRIDEIKRMHPLEVGQALFDRVYGQGAVADEAAFRTRVKEGLEAALARDGERIYRQLVMEALAGEEPIELPDAFLKRWISATNEAALTQEQIEEGYQEYAADLRAQLLEDSVVNRYGLEAKAEEVEAFARGYVNDQFLQYGLPDPGEEQVREMTARVLGDREQVASIRNNIVGRKLIAHFKAMLSPKEEKMKFEDFLELARSQRRH